MSSNRLRHACLAVACLLLVCTAPAGAQSPAASATDVTPAPVASGWPGDDAGLNALAATLLKDWAGRTSAAALEAVMLPGFQMVNFHGACDRSAASRAMATLGTTGATVSEVVATRAGDALVVTCMLRARETVDGTPLPAAASPRIGVWQQADGAWKLAAWGSLNMPATRPAPAAPAFAGDAPLNAQGEALVGRLLGAQHARKLDLFGTMLADGLQVINFKGQKVRKDLEQGARAATIDEPKITDARATRCGDLTVVTCTLTMGQKIGFTSLPADPAPFMAVFRGAGDAATVIAMANTNKPK